MSTQVDTSSEEWRHLCEFRWVAKMRPAQRFQYLFGGTGVAKYRGEQAAAIIDRDVRALLGEDQPGEPKP